MDILGSLSVLTAEQIRTYEDDGFLVIEDFFSSSEIDILRKAEASPAIQNALEEADIKHRTVHLLELTVRHPAFLDLAQHPRVVTCIQTLLGEDVQLQHSKLATKPVTRGVGAFGWHQDLAFYPHTNTSLLSVFVYLDDTTPENGGMSMVRGSHTLGPLTHLNEQGTFVGVCQESKYWEDNDGNVIPISPRAGAISIHHCLMLHGSPPNQSGKPRRGVVFSYRADDALQLGDTIFRDTGLIVGGTRRGIVRCQSIGLQLPLRDSTERRDYGSAHHQTGEWAEKRNIAAELSHHDR